MGRSLLCLLVAGCSAAPGSDLVIERVDPASAMNTAAVPLRVEGSGFHLPLTSDLDQGSTVVGDMAVTIGDIPLEATVWRGEQLIEGSVPAGLAAGSYDVTVMLGDRSGVLADGYVVLGDVTTTCVAGFLDVCMQPPPTTPLDISTADTINTDTDPRCRTVTQANGGPVCLVYATAVNIGAAGSLTATGSRPLAIASTSTLTIAGTIDVSSRRVGGQLGPAADDAGCTFAAVPELDLGGAAGAAGGSFGGLGGNGGTGDSDNTLGGDGSAAPGRAGPISTVAVMRGGCRGQQGGNESASGGVGGPGGHSGGALYLYAIGGIDVSGEIRATGAGGEGGQVQAGGGGGGTGGLVVIESPSITVTGQISANGGGGGGGGCRCNFVPVSGSPGTDGGLGTTAAPGGAGGSFAAGDGAAGGAGTMVNGVAGMSATVGAGGGGAGAGIIKLLGAPTVTGVVSPPPS